MDLDNDSSAFDLELYKTKLERDIENVSDVRKLADEIEGKLYAEEDMFVETICDNIEEVVELGNMIDELTDKFKDLQNNLTTNYDEICNSTSRIRELESETKAINTMITNREAAANSINYYLDLINVDQKKVKTLETLPVGSPEFITNLTYFDDKIALLSDRRFNGAKSATQCLNKLEDIKKTIDRRILNALSELMNEKSVDEFRSKVLKDELNYKVMFSFLLKTDTSPEAEKFIKGYIKRLATVIRTDIGARIQRLSMFKDPDIYTPPFGFLGLGKDYNYSQNMTQKSRLNFGNVGNSNQNQDSSSSPEFNSYIDRLSVETINEKVPKNYIVPQNIMETYEEYISGASKNYISKFVSGDIKYDSRCKNPEAIAAPFAIESYNRKELFEEIKIDGAWNDNIEAYVDTHKYFANISEHQTSKRTFKKVAKENDWMTTERVVYFLISRYINILESETKFSIRVLGTDKIVSRIVEETSSLLDSFITSRIEGTSDYSILLTMGLCSAAELKCEASVLNALKGFFTNWKMKLWTRLQPFVNRTIKIMEIANGVKCPASETTKRLLTRNKLGSQVDDHVPVAVTIITIQLAFLMRTLNKLEHFFPNLSKILNEKLFNIYTQYIYTVELGRKDKTCRSYNNFSFVARISESEKVEDIVEKTIESCVKELCTRVFPDFYRDYKMFNDEKLLGIGYTFQENLIDNISKVKKIIEEFEPTDATFKELMKKKANEELVDIYSVYYSYLKECLGGSTVMSDEKLVVPDVLKDHVCKSFGLVKK